MAFLTPQQKRDHFRDRRRMLAQPETIFPMAPMTAAEYRAALTRIQDEIELARRLGNAHVTTLRNALMYEASFADTARGLRVAARQHRRLWWYAAYQAVKELGAILAATNEWSPLSHDETGVDLDIDARRLLEWLVDEGRATRSRRPRS